jgi:hypothetical protein
MYAHAPTCNGFIADVWCIHVILLGALLYTTISNTLNHLGERIYAELPQLWHMEPRRQNSLLALPNRVAQARTTQEEAPKFSGFPPMDVDSIDCLLCCDNL